jgi:hypothetical protein
MKQFDTDREAENLQSKLNASIGRDPSKDAEVLTLSNETQLPFDVVERRLPEIRKRGQSDPYDAKGLIASHPRTAQYLSSGRNALAAAQDIPAMRDLEDELWGKRKGTPFLKNTVLAMGERTNDLTGNLVELVGNLYSEVSAFDPTIEFGEDGMSFNFIDDSPRDPNAFQRVGKAVSEGSLGYVPTFTWENLKGDLSVANLAGYVVETGAQSMVDMAAMLTTMPAYLASRTEEIAESRVENIEGRDNVTLADLAASVPTAVLVSLIDRFSAKGILGLADDVPVGTGFGFAAKEVGKKGVLEGGTEFIQEQIEYAGEVLGTDVDFDAMVSLDRGLAGAVAGGPMGATIRTLSLPANALAARAEKEVSVRVESAVEQVSIANIITKIKGMKLSQSAPAEQRKFLEGLDGDHQLYVTPEEVLAAAEEGLPVPKAMLDQATNNPSTDVTIKVSEFGADVVSNEQLLARLETHMKMSPNSMTRAEMDAKDSSKIGDMMARAKQDSELRSEADAIHASVTDQLVATKRMTRAQAAKQAQLIPAYVTTSVERLRERGIDISVTEMYEKMNFTVEAATAPTTRKSGPEVLAQSQAEGYEGTDPGEAQEWVDGVAKFGAEGMTTEARMSRAAEMGFDADTVYYHKSKNDFSEFSRDVESGWTNDSKTNGIYFASDPYYAGMYPGTTVYPTYLKKGARIKDVSSNLELSDQHKETRKAEQDGFTAVRITDNSLGEFIVFDPSQIRSVNAAFDPDASSSPNILAQGPNSGDGQTLKQSVDLNEITDSMQELDLTVPLDKQGVDPKIIARIEKHVGEDMLAVLVENANADIADLTGSELHQFMARILSEGSLPYYTDSVGDPDIDAVRYLRRMGLFVAARDVSDDAALYQEGESGPTVKGELEFFSDDSRIIKLFETSDESTFLHEAAHLFLETEKQLAAEFGLGENQQSILDFLELDSFDSIPVEKHELFARTFEQYLRTGDAPSPTLRDAFVEFARWLSRVYQSALALNAPLTDEAKGMFDRLLATQKEIEDSKTEPVWAQFFKDIKSAGMTEAQWAKYQAQVKRKSERAEGSLYDKLTKQYMSRRTTEWNQERKPLVEMAMERLEDSPIYGAIKAMREVPLDSEALKPFLAGNPKAAGRFIALRKADGSGMDPRLYVEQFGFESVEAMVNAITNAPALKVAATAEAQRLMIKKYGDILNDGTLEKEVRDSLHNAEQAKLLQMELAAMARRRRTKEPLDLKALRSDAKKIISQMRAADIRPDKFYRSEVRAAVAAGKAKTAEEAYQAKLQQLANHYLYKEALAARRNAAKYRKHMFGVLNRTYRTSEVAKEYVQEMKQLVRMYNMKTPDERDAVAAKFFTFMSGQLEAGVPIDLKDHNLILLDHRNRLGGSIDFSMPLVSDLTMDQLRSAYEQLVHLRHMGGVEAQKEKAELVEKRQTLVDALQTKISKAANKRQYKTEKQLERASAPKSLFYKLPSLRNLIRDLDNGDAGAFAKLLWTPIYTAENKKLSIHKEWYDELNNLMTGPDGKEFDLSSINDNKESRVTIPGTGLSMTARERVMLALYWGEEYSRDAVIDGYRKAPTGEMELDEEGNSTKIKKKGEKTVSVENVEEMLENLTDQQIEIVNRIWQFHDYISAPLFESEYKRGGVAPEKIPAVPFEIRGKPMRGGHMRLYYHGQPTMELAAEATLISTNNVTPSKHGSVYERLGSGGKKVSMNMDNIFRNITEAIHKVAYTDAARELNQIYAHRSTREAITDAMGQGFEQALFENIRGLVTDMKEPQGDKYIAAASRWLRTSASSMYLSFGVRNIVQQFGTIITAVDELPGASYAVAVAEFASDWDGNTAKVNELSPQMASRDVNLNREHSEMLARVDTGTRFEKYVQVANRYGFKPHVFIDGMIAYPLWLKVYNNAIEQHGDLVRAASEADVSVAETVGSGLDINIGKFFRSNESEFIKLMGLFGSWFNGVIFQRAYKSTEGGSKVVSTKAARQLIAVPFALAAATQWLVADFPDEDDEEGLLSWSARTYLGFMSGTIPMSGMFVSEMRGFGAQSMTTSVAGKLAQGLTLPGRAFGEDSEMTASEGLYELLTITGTVMPVPGLGNVTRMLQYYNSRQDGNEDEIEDILGWTQETYQALVEGSDKNR